MNSRRLTMRYAGWEAGYDDAGNAVICRVYEERRW